MLIITKLVAAGVQEKKKEKKESLYTENCNAPLNSLNLNKIIYVLTTAYMQNKGTINSNHLHVIVII